MENHSLNAKTFPPIPTETARAARAIFGRSNFYLFIGEQANRLFDGIDLEYLSGRIQESALIPGMFYLITIFQYIETLPDLSAADALRERLDWKYALHLPISYLQVQPASLCEFRNLLLLERSGVQNFQTLLVHLSEITQSAGKQLHNRQAPQIIAQVCMFSRMAKIWDAINQALEAIATRQPDWLLKISLPHWYERFGHPRRNLDLRVDHLEQAAFAQAIGLDGAFLLKAISEARQPELKKLPEVLTLMMVWQEQYFQLEDKLLFRKEACALCDGCLNSPDPSGGERNQLRKTY
jgi:transposase